MFHFLFIGTTEIIIIALIVVLLFGGRKIPELMKGLGRGVRSFKEGVNEVKTEIDEEPAPGRPSAQAKEDKGE